MLDVCALSSRNRVHLLRVFTGGPRQEHNPRAGKACKVVDVAVCVLVSNQPKGQPDDLGDSQQLAQHAFDLLLGEARIAVWVQQALFCREQRPDRGVNNSVIVPLDWLIVS